MSAKPRKSISRRRERHKPSYTSKHNPYESQQSSEDDRLSERLCKRALDSDDDGYEPLQNTKSKTTRRGKSIKRTWSNLASTQGVHRGHAYGNTSVFDNGTSVQGDQIFNGPVLNLNSAGIDPNSTVPEIGDAEAAQAILRSLKFFSMDERFARISKAHAKTFAWALQQHDDPSSPYAAFREWLQGSGKVPFWIYGKPGSGKSTLMRFLASSTFSKTILDGSSKNVKPIVAKCFLWNAGNDLQKSVQGLLRSLLYDILQTHPELHRVAFPHRWQFHKQGHNDCEEWSKLELLTALQNLVRGLQPETFVLAFVDGLDEFEGSDSDRIELNELLKTLAEAPHVKICTSSRPWPVFADAFRSAPKIRLEDLTKEDITLYVHDRFQQSCAFQEMEAMNPGQASIIITKLVSRAQGVFLWVHLVTEELLKELQQGHSLSVLNQTLESIPPDLNGYFQRIFDSIEPRHHRQAAALFLVSLHAQKTFLSTITFIEEQSLNFDAWPFGKSSPAVDARESLLTRLVESRCKGLLQTQSMTTCGKLYRTSLDFLHRTVRDFLLFPKVNTQLRVLAADFDVERYIFDAFNTYIKHSQPEDVCDIIDLVAGFMEEIRFGQTLDHGILRNSIDRLSKILDECLHQFHFDLNCLRYHDSSVTRVLGMWDRDGRSMNLLLQALACGFDRSSANINYGGRPHLGSDGLVVCPFIVRARMSCWTGQGPCECYTDEFKVCAKWSSNNADGLKLQLEHLEHQHSRPEHACLRCQKDLKSFSMLAEHHQSIEACERKQFNVKWSCDTKQLDLVRRETFDESSYWFLIYSLLFPESPLTSEDCHAASVETGRKKSDDEFSNQADAGIIMSAAHMAFGQCALTSL